jgi:phage terminase large subunit-like protein
VAVNRDFLKYDKSQAEILASLPAEERKAVLAGFSDAELRHMYNSWEFWARPKQILPKGDWLTWFIVSGRGFGKTRTGAEAVRQWVREGYKRIALIGQTKSDVRDTMLFGESGLMTVCQNDDNPPEYIASKRVVRWANGAQAFLYSGDEPEQMRGPQHEKGWVDELAKFKKAEECWDNFILGLRLGDNPQCVCTTTPKPLQLIKELLNDEETYVTTGSTYENYGNLSHKFIKHVVKKYEGTKLGKQELWGRLLEDIEGALWKWDLLNQLRVKAAPPLKRIIVAIDPAATSKETSDETGIIAAGLGHDGNAYILSDVTNIYTPTDWAKAAINEYKRLRADKVVAETNNGGEMVETVLRVVDPTIPYHSVWAARGKYVRAEPVAGLYEQHRVFHVCQNPDDFNALEVEMTEWVPAEAKKSPNRVDALVWAISELMLEKKEPRGKIRPLSMELRRVLA